MYLLGKFRSTVLVVALFSGLLFLIASFSTERTVAAKVASNINHSGNIVSQTTTHHLWLPFILHNTMSMVWTSLGPAGVNVDTLAVDPSIPDILYAGTFNNGAWRSLDGGQTWMQMDNGLPANESVQHFAAVPKTPTQLYAGVRDYYKIYRSENNGDSWQAMTPPHPYSIYSLAVNPVSPTIVFAGIGILDTNTGGHVVRSTDGGQTWTQILPDFTMAQELVVDPDNPDVVYVGRIWGGGVLKSYDGGNNWQPINNGLSGSALTIRQIKIDPNNSQVLFMTTEGGVFNSKDGGHTWLNIGASLPTQDISAIALSPQQSGLVWVTPGTTNSSESVYQSSDYGASWWHISDVPDGLYIETMFVVRDSPFLLYAVGDPVGDNKVWQLSSYTE